MTAFARREITGIWGNAAWELRSINHRYLETYIRLPEQLIFLEQAIRERIRLCLTRGKVECNLYFYVNPNVQSTLIINKTLAKQVIAAAKWVKIQSQEEGTIEPLEILRWPGVMSTTEQELDTISAELLLELDATCKDLISARETEGKALKKLIEKRLAGVSAESAKVRQQMPTVLVWQREKLLNKLQEAQVKLDSNRIEQELVILAQRIDIAEELDRIDTHVKETYHILNKPEAVGRRLDFIMQELHRESNTLAAKSVNTSVTASAD
ncbi:conserved hypothetical protein [Candidatus Moranella endobia PCIT]|uniref:YicC family protein n=1 Tax=Moranella endobia (strain PCIT) TaxID=903503 RepID=F7XXN4_MOREP|nr:conserved hypothetical protein [Candidatus Moranella endobia PCIT]